MDDDKRAAAYLEDLEDIYVLLWAMLGRIGIGIPFITLVQDEAGLLLSRVVDRIQAVRVMLPAEPGLTEEQVRAMTDFILYFQIATVLYRQLGLAEPGLDDQIAFALISAK